MRDRQPVSDQAINLRSYQVAGLIHMRKILIQLRTGGQPQVLIDSLDFGIEPGFEVFEQTNVNLVFIKVL
jgi:hypothetical protein